MSERTRGPRGRGPRGRGDHERGGRTRGDIRLVVLSLLNEADMHGYQLMREIKHRSNGSWRPSPGSIYPLLQQMTDDGLVVPNEDGDRKVFTLTDLGRESAAQESADQVWDKLSSRSKSDDLRSAQIALVDAVSHLSRSGTEEQLTAAEAILIATRKQIYGLLAAD